MNILFSIQAFRYSHDGTNPWYPSSLPLTLASELGTMVLEHHFAPSTNSTDSLSQFTTIQFSYLFRSFEIVLAWKLPEPSRRSSTMTATPETVLTYPNENIVRPFFRFYPAFFPIVLVVTGLHVLCTKKAAWSPGRQSKFSPISTSRRECMDHTWQCRIETWQKGTTHTERSKFWSSCWVWGYWE